MSKTPHSAPVLNDLRDGWWNTDFLELLATRMQWNEVQTIADIGCGHGHWGHRLLPMMSDNGTIEGVDLEQEWVEKARNRTSQLGYSERARYQQSSAEELPFDNASFDLVTCQTLLMHVPDVPTVLGEMLRILKPGGRLLLSEPNNLAHSFTVDSANQELSPDQLGELMTLFSACSRGRAVLGRGDDCVGDLLPAMLADLNLENISSSQNERMNGIYPPYSAEQRADLELSASYMDKEFWLWNKADARVLYLAGGGHEERFEKHYGVFATRTETFKAQVLEGKYRSSGASLGYVITATKAE